MNNPASSPPEAAPAAGNAAHPAARRDRMIGLGCAALLLIGMPIAYLPGDTVALVVVGLVSLAIMAWIILWLVPRERAAARGRAHRSALILGVLALLTTLVFWTGLPLAIGAGAIALGLSLREAAPAGGRGKATAALALGSFAVVASFIAMFVG